MPQFYKHIKLIIDHFYQMIDQKGLVIMSREKQDEERDKRKQKCKGKQFIHQVIDLQNQGLTPGVQPGDALVGELSKKCGIFFNWISKTSSPILGEQLWKNQKILEAAELFPELDNNQLQRLVDRDWRYMGQDRRLKIIKSYSYEPNEYEIERMIEQVEKDIYIEKV